MPAGGGWEVEAGRKAECWNERHRARLASLRAEDRAHRDIERGKLGRWRRARRGWQASRAQHARESRPDKYLFWAEWNHVGRVQVYNSLLAIAKIRYTHRAAVAKIGYSSISAFATRPGLHLTGWVDRF